MSSSQSNSALQPARAGAADAEYLTPHSAVRVPALVAPAGDWECARAAVENGADAIYFGLEKFNARMRAHNFTEADLPRLMEYLHRRGVKGYVTFNILVFENELAEAEQYARAIIAAGVDAAVVQDVGVCRLLRRLSPDFPIHVSTQMTITSAAGVEFARQLGADCVVLARECSLKEIEKIVSSGECRVASFEGEVQSPKFKLQSPESQDQSRESEVRRAAAQEHASRITHHASLPSSPVTRHPSLPLEVFIHGALCVAYSGQCLTSEALGGRSANRGECAQACRLPYELLADGKQVPLGERKYLLSPQDLAGLEVLPELVRLGVASLKIEGRLKSPEYVANITRIYRNALDRLKSDECRGSRVEGEVQTSNSKLQAPEKLQNSVPKALGDHVSRFTHHESRITNHALPPASPAPRHSPLAFRHPQYEMEMAFSRGLYTGWFRGTNNQALVHGRFGKKRGVYLGEVSEVRRDAVLLDLEGPLKPGDGVVFDAGHPEAPEEGGRVYEVSNSKLQTPGKPENQSPNREVVEIRFGHGDINFNRVHVGDKVWKTSDPELDRRLRQSFEGDTPRFRRPISMEVHGLAGQPLTLIVRDELGHTVRLDSAIPLAKAEKQPLTTERLREQLGRLGGTPFELGDLKNFLEGALLVPVSELNRLRREAVKGLEVLRGQPPRWTLECGMQSAECRVQNEEGRMEAGVSPDRAPSAAASTARLVVLIRNLAQLEAALRSGVETLYCDFEDPKKYRDAVRMVRSSSHGPLVEIFVAPPRIFKMGEEWTLKQVRSSEADGYLVRNYDHLNFFAQDRRIGDYSLNIANRLAADYFKTQFGLERVTASYDLNFTQLEALLQGAPPDWFEVTIHQHIPMFHMEHCLFCAFLSSGTDYTNCGRPCDRHDLKLRDRVGAEHPVKADAGCRNTVFNARAQTGADYVARMLALGVRHFRLEFLNETPDQVTQTVARYRQLLRGEITGPELWRELKLLNQLGVTRGQMGN